MGYSHYWRYYTILDAETFKKVGKDFKKLLPIMERMGLKLGNGCGEKKPVVNSRTICFNGLENCGHPKSEVPLGLVWPSDTASGSIGGSVLEERATDGWIAGAYMNKRVCGGECDYEGCCIDRLEKLERPWNYNADDPKRNRLQVFGFCKTNYKPYDIAVTAFLIILKQYYKDAVTVGSDGEGKDWKDGAMLCQQFLGYGEDFKIDREDDS